MRGDRADFYESMLSNYNLTPLRVSTEFTILQLIIFFKRHGEKRKEMLDMAKENSKVLEVYLSKIKKMQAEKEGK